MKVAAVNVTAVILAAGASRRLGQAKQLVVIGGERLLDRAVRLAREVGCNPVVVVLGAEAERIRATCELSGVTIVTNEEWMEGMGSSVRAGIEALEGGVEGVLLMTCDQPAVTAEHLRSLTESGEVTASAYAGRQGVPAYFPMNMLDKLRSLQGDFGARKLLADARARSLERGELDIDTFEALAEARSIYG